MFLRFEDIFAWADAQVLIPMNSATDSDLFRAPIPIKNEQSFRNENEQTGA